MLRWYTRLLAKRPLLTQATTTAFLFATGDVAAQQMVEKKGVKEHDWIRTGRMFGYGGIVFGPAAATWFTFLSTKVRLKNNTHEVIARVLIDQGVFAPTFLAVFLSTMAVLEGADPRERLERSWLRALMSNYMVWPAVQSVNFMFVPLQHRLMFVNLIAVWWNCYLSWLNGLDAQDFDDDADLKLMAQMKREEEERVKEEAKATKK